MVKFSPSHRVFLWGSSTYYFVGLALACLMKNGVHLVLSGWTTNTPVTVGSLVPLVDQGQGSFSLEKDHIYTLCTFLWFIFCVLAFLLHPVLVSSVWNKWLYIRLYLHHTPVVWMCIWPVGHKTMISKALPTVLKFGIIFYFWDMWGNATCEYLILWKDLLCCAIFDLSILLICECCKRMNCESCWVPLTSAYMHYLILMTALRKQMSSADHINERASTQTCLTFLYLVYSWHFRRPGHMFNWALPGWILHVKASEKDLPEVLKFRWQCLKYSFMA